MKGGRDGGMEGMEGGVKGWMGWEMEGGIGQTDNASLCPRLSRCTLCSPILPLSFHPPPPHYTIKAMLNPLQHPGVFRITWGRPDPGQSCPWLGMKSCDLREEKKG